MSVCKAVRWFKSQTKVIRGSNWCLKFLTFQLSNYRGFEIVKYAFAYREFCQDVRAIFKIDLAPKITAYMLR